MQWIRFRTDLAIEVEAAYEAWKEQFPAADPANESVWTREREPVPDHRVSKLMDTRFVDYLASTGIPFERP